MTQSAPQTPATPPSSKPTRSGPGFITRLFAALLVILITTVLVLGIGAAGLISLGFTPDMPQQIATSRALLATAQTDAQVLRLQQNVAQTQVAENARRSDTARESLDQLEQDVAALKGVRDQLAADSSRNATMVAEASDSREAVVVFATAEAGRSALLDTLQRRSERIERFVQRLNDISSDTALDLGAGTPEASTPTSQATATTGRVVPTETLPTQTVTVTPSASPTSATSPTRSP
jgi:hypothetical protein